MNEIQRITNYNSEELPSGQKSILIVQGIDNPKEVLGICKKAMISFLEKKNIEAKDNRWKTLIPKDIVSFLSLPEPTDFSNDHYLFSMESIISFLKNHKTFEWYSSNISPEGFKIIFMGSFNSQCIWFVHCQNIPLSKISIEDDRFGSHRLNTIKDVTTYKKFG